MNICKYNCLICHYPFDDSIHLPRILNECEHTICSLCISRRLLSSNKTFICPKDNTVYSNIESVVDFKVNENIIEKIKQLKEIENENNNIKDINNNNMKISDSYKIDYNTSEKTSIPSQKESTKTQIDSTANKDSTLFSNDLIPSINNKHNNQQCYIKKITKFGKKLKVSNDVLICSIHSLPLNIICVDDRQRICSQCALNNLHLNHQIIPENKFTEYINELIKVYEKIESNLNSYENINNISSQSILEEIEKKINNFKNEVKYSCDELIDSISKQSKQIEKYLDLRKKEIFNKYQFTNYDINNLRETTNNWINTACDKFIQANSGNLDELNFECLKLLDIDTNKNIFSLINVGKQLNERYNFINETKDVIDKLNEFNKNGINLEINKHIINAITKNKDINYNENSNLNNNEEELNSIINISKDNNISVKSFNSNIKEKSKIANMKLKQNNIENNNIFEIALFRIEENKKIIESLHLTPISQIHKQINNIFITYDDEFDNGFNNTLSNISNILSPKLICDSNTNNMNNIYSKKTINTINSNNQYNTSKNEYVLTFKNDNVNKNKNNIFDENNIIFNRINLANDKIKSRQNKLSLSAGKYKTAYEKKNFNIGNLSKEFTTKKSFPKLVTVKTCDELFIAPQKRKTSQDSFLFPGINNIKYRRENTLLRLPMSPKLKTVYNIISKNMKINNIYSDQRYNNQNYDNTSNNNLNNLKDEHKNKENNGDKYKTKYVRCVSCSSALNTLNKKDIQDISILFNLKDQLSQGYNIKKFKRNKNINDSDISTITNNTKLNNDSSQHSHHHNRSCIKQNVKAYFNFKSIKDHSRDYNSRSQKKIITSFVNKNENELRKYINIQMKRTSPIFNRINMQGLGIQLLCSYIHKNQIKKYKELKLPGCNLNDDDFIILIKCIIDHELEIPILNVSYNKLGDNSAKYIIEINKGKSHLKNIFLYNNMFSKTLIEKMKNINKNKDPDNIKFFL